MILIGERINAGFSEVKKALKEKNPQPIQDLALRQHEAGADYLDLNMTPVSKDPEDMVWLVETVQAKVDTGIAIDSQKPEVIKPALEACANKTLINSTTAQEEKMEKLFPLAVEYNSSIIGVTSGQEGAPQDVNGRLELGAKLFSKANKIGLENQKLFIDPVAMPLKFMQKQASNVLESVRQLSNIADPPPHLTLGLSNLSSDAKKKSLINRTFLVMAMAEGLDAAICDVLDDTLMEAVATAEIVLNNEIYSDSFSETYRMR